MIFRCSRYRSVSRGLESRRVDVRQGATFALVACKVPSLQGCSTSTSHVKFKYLFASSFYFKLVKDTMACDCNRFNHLTTKVFHPLGLSDC